MNRTPLGLRIIIFAHLVGAALSVLSGTLLVNFRLFDGSQANSWKMVFSIIYSVLAAIGLIQRSNLVRILVMLGAFLSIFLVPLGIFLLALIGLPARIGWILFGISVFSTWEFFYLKSQHISWQFLGKLPIEKSHANRRIALFPFYSPVSCVELLIFSLQMLRRSYPQRAK